MSDLHQQTLAERTERTSDPLLYLYGVVPADAPPPPGDLVGLEGLPVRMLCLDRVNALVSEVDASEYDSGSLDARTKELAWVSARAIAHERVLTWYAERGPVIPLALLSLHRDEIRVKARVESHRDQLDRLLRELRGAKAWSVRIRQRRATLEDHVDELSPTLADLTRQIEAAGEGRRFLLEKKRAAALDKELRKISARVARELFADLREVARRGTVVPVSAPDRGGEGASRLILDSAFLVPDADFDSFRERLSAAARRHGRIGFDFELAGPLPPYHFAKLA